MSQQPGFDFYGDFSGWDSNGASEVNSQMIEWAASAALIGHFPGSYYYGGSKPGFDIEVAGLGMVEIKRAWRNPRHPDMLYHSPMSDKQVATSKYCAMVVIVDDTTSSNDHYAADGSMSIELSVQIEEIYLVPVPAVVSHSKREGDGRHVIPLTQLAGCTLSDFVTNFTPTSDQTTD